MLHNCPGIDEWHKGVPRSVRVPTIMGGIVLLVWGVGFGLWAALAPLDGAVVASGSFVATGQNKHVQHFEGGILRDINVREGDLVERGQVLVKLDETAPRARLRRLELRKWRLLAMMGRLQAETQMRPEMEMPPELLDAPPEPEVRDIIIRQKIELLARRGKLMAETEVLRREIAGLQESIEGFNAQIDATRAQLSYFKEELTDKGRLLERQLVRKSDILAVQRSESRVTGELGQLLSRVADSRERIARANQQITQVETAAVQKAVEELRITETDLDDVKEQIRAAMDVVERLEVTAPVRGVVVKLNHHTSGGVIAPGATILELLPVNEELVIEARVSPHDITHVKEGQAGLVRLSALNQRLVPMISGNVTYVSADAVNETDPRKAALNPAASGSFVVRVKIDEKDLYLKAHDFRPTPGMPADIFIKTGQRTFFQYLMKPLLDSLAHAFREQ